MQNLKKYALSYAKKGWHVFPLKEKSKKPATNHGFKNATTNHEQIEKWWSQNPNYNIGVAAGKKSGVVILDLDLKRKKLPPHTVVANGAELVDIMFDWQPSGLFQYTGGGGIQAFFKHPGFKCKNGENLFARDSGEVTGIDIRGDGGYVVVPPSIHPNGKTYEWGENPNSDLDELPEWILGHYKNDLKDAINENIKSNQKKGIDPLEILKGVPEGERNSKLFKYACRLESKDMVKEEAEILVQKAADACEGEYPAKGDETIQDMILRVYTTFRKEDKDEDVEVIYTVLSDVTPTRLKWLWPDRIPIGKLSLFAGDPGLGKSLVTIDLAARVSTGSPWPDNTYDIKKPGDVVFLSAEDDIQDTIRPRLDAAKADCTRIVALNAIRERDKDGEPKDRPFNLQTDVARLGTICHQRDVKLIIIDPISAYIGSTDSHNNAEVRVMLTPLQELAQEHGIAVIGVTHLRKSSGKAIYRALGSLAFTAAARAVWGVALDSEDESGETKLFLPIKMNLSQGADGLSYSVIPKTVDGIGELPAVAWNKDRISRSQVEKHLSDEHNDGGSGNTKLDQAKKFLTKILNKFDGDPVPAAEIIEIAEDASITERTLKRAKKELEVQSKKEGGEWVWTL